MDMDSSVELTSQEEARSDLERFRSEWLLEVARNRRVGGHLISGEGRNIAPQRKDVAASLPSGGLARKETGDYSEEIEPRSYHDLEDKQDSLKLGKDGDDHDRSRPNKPSSALEHYEHAVEKETRGQLGDSITHYRKAFKLDAGVHEVYKKKYYPPSAFVKSKPSNPNPSNASVTVPNPAHHSLYGGSSALSPSLKQLLDDFAELRIEAAPPLTSISPQEPCRLAALPEEILTQILAMLATSDVAELARVALVCKRLAYLVLTEQGIWRAVAMGDKFGFKAMFSDYACDIDGFPALANNKIAQYLGTSDDIDEEEQLLPSPEQREAAFTIVSEQLLHTNYSSSWRQMFRLRPRIRFNGCYISTVNYTRPGATSTNTLSWGAPVHVVTYFRYLRFFRDGTVISLLTTSEPADVVHHLTKEHLHGHHNNTLPSSVMKDALRGRWRLSGPVSSVFDPQTYDVEAEGDVHIETESPVPRYTYKLTLALAHAGKNSRNNKLAWKGYWSHNRLTDDWAEFALTNDRPFYWSRVKSYGVGY